MRGRRSDLAILLVCFVAAGACKTDGGSSDEVRSQRRPAIPADQRPRGTRLSSRRVVAVGLAAANQVVLVDPAHLTARVLTDFDTDEVDGISVTIRKGRNLYLGSSAHQQYRRTPSSLGGAGEDRALCLRTAQ